MKYMYSMSKLSLTLHTFSITSSVTGLFLTLNIIEKYMKQLNNVNIKDTNLSITLDIIKSVIKSTYTLNDIFLTSYPQVIKISPKSNMAIK